MSDSTGLMYVCRRCKQHHDGPWCSDTKAVEYYEGGAIKRVEYFSPADYPTAQHTHGLPTMERWPYPISTTRGGKA